MSRESNSVPEHIRHSAHKKVVDALISDPKNQTLTSGEIYKAKADKLEAERYDPVMDQIDKTFNLLLEQMVRENKRA